MYIARGMCYFNEDVAEWTEAGDFHECLKSEKELITKETGVEIWEAVKDSPVQGWLASVCTHTNQYLFTHRQLQTESAWPEYLLTEKVSSLCFGPCHLYQMDKAVYVQHSPVPHSPPLTQTIPVIVTSIFPAQCINSAFLSPTPVHL